MTQPPLSRQIQKLERAVGVSLLERDNRSVALTDAGKAFLDEARGLLNSVERATHHVQQIAAGKRGLLNVGFTAATGFSVLGTILDEIHEHMPGVHVDLHELVTGEQVEQLRSGNIDFGLGRLTGVHEELRSRVIHSERLVAAVPTSDRLVDGSGTIRRSDLSGRTIIMHSPERAKYFSDLITKHFTTSEFRVEHYLGQITTMINLTVRGHGVALVPESAKSLRIEGVEFLGFEDLEENIAEICAMWNKRSTNPALSLWLSHKGLDWP